MFPTFTGSSRKPRQVNLSGRKTTPQKPQVPGLSLAPQQHSSSFLSAQQQRIKRENERRKLEAAKKIQSAWRGRKEVSELRKRWRKEWDEVYGEQFSGGRKIHDSNKAMKAMRLFLGFFDRTWSSGRGSKRVGPSQSGDDFTRLHILLGALTIENHQHYIVAEDLRDQDFYTICRFMEILLITLAGLPTTPQLLPLIVSVLRFISQFPSVAARVITSSLPPYLSSPVVAPTYYEVLSSITTNLNIDQNTELQDILLKCLLGPLSAPVPPNIHSQTALGPHIYRALANQYLITPHLKENLGETTFDDLASHIQTQELSDAIITNIEEERQPQRELASKGKSSTLTVTKELPANERTISVEKKLWLTAYIIYFFRKRIGRGTFERSNSSYVKCLTSLLGDIAGEVSKRLDVEDEIMIGSGSTRNPLQVPDDYESGEESEDPENTEDAQKGSRRKLPLPNFVKEQLRTLIEQSSVSSLFSETTSFTQLNDQSSGSIQAQLLASYALTLLLVFPRKKQNLCMWLYLANTEDGFPAVRYLWEAVKTGKLFADISGDVNAAIESLQRQRKEASRHVDSSNFRLQSFRYTGQYQAATSEKLDSKQCSPDNSEWQAILLFLELYSFLLGVMDDEDFFKAGCDVGTKKRHSIASGEGSRTRDSVPPLEDVKPLTVFLKNLAFAMYWYGDKIRNPRSDTIPRGRSINATDIAGEIEIAGVKGMGFEYVKRVVTNLLQAIYTRDSRRKFLPKDHWLMTAHFDMAGFIPAVVAEEEKRHRIEEGEEDEDQMSDTVYGLTPLNPLLRNRQQFAMKPVQRRYVMEAVGPRLEILQHLPFFIPFHTRVQIFREFVAVDQRRRRGGQTDPDAWRAMLFHRMARTTEQDPRETLSKHHATIRREYVFEDAFSEFYPLGDGLKEPIQITFVDKFGAQEAGIDGGGVTKEFLTSVTKEAFVTERYNLFLENKQHMLYPKPTSIDELRESLKEVGSRQEEIDALLTNLLRQYEFLGRIVGKCMYEGILVDVNFAPVFLMQWTAGRGNNGYRPGVNDLRDLDEDLYQGLVALKNYTGDVESDFGLNFTMSYSLENASGKTKTVTVELKPNGSNISVTSSTRLEYIHLVSKYRLVVQPRRQISAFLQGLGSIIPPSWLSMFNQSELQTLVGGGDNPIDVADLRRNTTYGGVYDMGDDRQEHPVIQNFWKVLEEDFTDEERRKVLKFVTSVSRAPLLGFGMLRPRFSIRDGGDDQERLPSTSTCVNLLKLPRYKDRETLRKKLWYAVNAQAGFDLS